MPPQLPAAPASQRLGGLTAPTLTAVEAHYFCSPLSEQAVRCCCCAPLLRRHEPQGTPPMLGPGCLPPACSCLGGGETRSRSGSGSSRPRCNCLEVWQPLCGFQRPVVQVGGEPGVQMNLLLQNQVHQRLPVRLLPPGGGNNGQWGYVENEVPTLNRV